MSDDNLLNDPARPPVGRPIVDRNPFYLLSAVCMLFGCLALTNSLSWSPIKLQRLILLAATLNFYELLLVGLAVFLIARRGLRRDGTILLILEIFFLVDVTFLNSEIFSTDLHIGLIVNSILLVLAVVKVGVIFLGLGISLASGAFAIAMIELLLLFALPGVFKLLATRGDATLPPMAIYAAWWVIGLLPIPTFFLIRNRRDPDHPRLQPLFRSRGIVGLLVILPVISLIAHVSTSNWIYNVPWHVANLSPLLLGLAVAIGLCDWHVHTLGWRMGWQFVLPIAALVMSVKFPGELVFQLGPVGFSPLRCTLLGTMLVYLQGFILHGHILFAWAACMCLGSAGIGLSIQQILGNLNVGAKQTYTFGRSIWPRTLAHWGVISVVMSFVLLAMGARMSLKKPVEEKESGLSAED